MPRRSFESSKKSSEREAKRNESRKKSFRQRSANAPTWDAINPVKLHALVALATTYGASPTFGYTRDGTSLVMGMWYDGERSTDYLNGNEDFDAYLEWAVTELLEVEEQDLAPYAMIATKKA